MKYCKLESNGILINTVKYQKSFENTKCTSGPPNGQKILGMVTIVRRNSALHEYSIRSFSCLTHAISWNCDFLILKPFGFLQNLTAPLMPNATTSYPIPSAHLPHDRLALHFLRVHPKNVMEHFGRQFMENN